MLKLKGCYWEGGLAALEEPPCMPPSNRDEEEEEEWEKEATSALETLGGVVVDDGSDTLSLSPLLANVHLDLPPITRSMCLS